MELTADVSKPPAPSSSSSSTYLSQSTLTCSHCHFVCLRVCVCVCFFRRGMDGQFYTYKIIRVGRGKGTRFEAEDDVSESAANDNRHKQSTKMKRHIYHHSPSSSPDSSPNSYPSTISARIRPRPCPSSSSASARSGGVPYTSIHWHRPTLGIRYSPRMPYPRTCR